MAVQLSPDPILQVLSAETYDQWVQVRREAEVSLQSREEKLFLTAKMIESELELLGM